MISLSPDHVGYIDAQVTSGCYVSASEVVRAGLCAPLERDAAVEGWLREQVTPAYYAMQADPSRAITADVVVRTLRAHHANQLKGERDI